MSNTQFNTFAKLFLSLLLVIFVFSASTTKSAQLLDRVVAVVNDDVITLTELESESQEYFERMRQKSTTMSPQELEQARDKILTKLISQRLISQQAEKANIKITEKELERTYAENLRKLGLNREEFIAQLQQSGFTEEKYKGELRSKLLRDKLVLYEVRSKIVITEEMISEYYNTEYTGEIAEGGYYILQMGFKWEEDNSGATNTQEEALGRAKSARERTEKGADFGSIARQESDLPSAVDGGDLGVFQEDEMAQYMRDAVLPLKVGEISEIIETPIGYQFFKLLSTQKGDIVQQVPYDTVKEEIRKKLFEKKFSEEYKTWVEGIQEGSYVKRMLN